MSVFAACINRMSLAVSLGLFILGRALPAAGCDCGLICAPDFEKKGYDFEWNEQSVVSLRERRSQKKKIVCSSNHNNG